MLLNKEKKQKSNEMYYGESVDCDIIMQPVIQCYLLSLQVLQNQQIVVLKPWLCGSVKHTANRNKHHGEETTPLFCCSAWLCWSMHQPGYVQGGQEVGRGYLLLGIHYRRIRQRYKKNMSAVYWHASPLITPPSLNRVKGQFTGSNRRICRLCTGTPHRSSPLPA